MITVYTITYNEELILPYFIKHYRDRFPNCDIVVYDNYSTDNTAKIASFYNCSVIKYDTNNELSDRTYLKIKNNVWKDSNTDWVVVCDADEFLDIDYAKLQQEQKMGTTIIKSTAYDMINPNVGEIDIGNMKYGVRNEYYDKCLMFNKKYIKEIRYEMGCHTCIPRGVIKYNRAKYRMYHNSYIEENYKINRYLVYSRRMSEENLINNWGCYYLNNSQQIIESFSNIRKKAIKIIK